MRNALLLRDAKKNYSPCKLLAYGEMNATLAGVIEKYFAVRFGLYLVFALSLQPQTRNEPPRGRLTRARVAEEGK